MSRAAGIPDEKVAALASWRDSDLFDDDEKLVIEFAEAMTNTPVHVSDDLFDRVKARFSTKAIVELTATVAWENFVGRFNRALGVEPQGFSER